ncbi:flavin reductase family protein [Gordonia sp. DT30]|uniref:flavin reductase family protein n=1 Tax=Gordonia sp. DT30 TaxID=3416546 RepID=UPI003CECB153
MPADSAAIRSAFSRFPSGIAALCAAVEGEPVALVASSFQVGISLDPPLVLFSVQQSSTTWPRLRRATHLGVSILGADHGEICAQLAAKDKSARFKDIETIVDADSAVFLPNSALLMKCSIRSETAAGDHRLILLEVLGVRADTRVEPLIFHGSEFRGLDRR